MDFSWFSSLLADHETWWLVLAWAMIGVGLAGSVLPVLPGSPLILAGVWLAAWRDDYAHIGWPTLTLLALLVVISQIVDYVAGAAGAKAAGASRQAVWGALLGAIFGLFFGLPGLLLGPFVGAVAGELLAQSSLPRAARVGLASWLGFIVGAVVKLLIALVMLIVAAIGWWLI